MGMGQNGHPAILHSPGNPLAHLILRGANSGSNYQLSEIEKIRAKFKDHTPTLVIDCSHGNSHKDPMRQPEVLLQIIAERHLSQVRGVMLESHLVDGQQKISTDMTYGQSVTDGCLGWNKTEMLLLEISEQLKATGLKRSA